MEDFLKCQKNCMISATKGTELKGCIFGKSLDVEWVEENTVNTKGNITCTNCSAKQKRIFFYDRLSFYHVGLSVCYKCGEIGWVIKDGFSKGTIWDKDTIKRLCETHEKQYLLEIFNQIDMFNSVEY